MGHQAWRQKHQTGGLPPPLSHPLRKSTASIVQRHARPAAASSHCDDVRSIFVNAITLSMRKRPLAATLLNETVWMALVAKCLHPHGHVRFHITTLLAWTMFTSATVLLG